MLRYTRYVHVYYGLSFPITGWMIGSWLQKLEYERLSKFRDKSALYGRTLAPGEPPSWP